jgi:CheY-like chemotaxis protein
MTVILVLDDAPARAALAETLGRLFPHARVIAGTEAELARVADGSIVLTGLVVAERIGLQRRRPPLRVVALTPEMGPATLMKAEAAGVYATLRSPATAEGLRAVLEPIVGRGTSSGTEGR